MSIASAALEAAVTELIQARAALDAAPGPRGRARADRAFARLLRLSAPRIRYFTRLYGLGDFAEDAAQVCALALHRAVERYDPARARFTTYVGWQFRAELQALRLRLNGDPRCAGRREVTAMLSLDSLTEAAAEPWLADPLAEQAVERAAADRLAARCADRLVSQWAARREWALSRAPRTTPARIADKVGQERALVRRQLDHVDTLVERLGESDRHIVRRAFADMARHAGTKPH